LVFAGNEADMSVHPYVLHDSVRVYHLIAQNLSFYTRHLFAFDEDSFTLQQLKLPEDAELSGLFKGPLLLLLRSDGQPQVGGPGFGKGSLVSLSYEKLLKNLHDVRLLVKPDAHSSIAEVSQTKDLLVVNLLRNVQNELRL